METCPCCGHKVFEQSGNYEICPICFWEDDGVQLADPWFAGGANVPGLVEAQKNYKKYGAMEKRFQGNVRKPTDNDEKDSEWRLVDESDREFVTTPREIEEQLKNNRVIPYEYWKRNA
jgi:hypothetical protein